jgi:hypothetical protein
MLGFQGHGKEGVSGSSPEEGSASPRLASTSSASADRLAREVPPAGRTPGPEESWAGLDRARSAARRPPERSARPKRGYRTRSPTSKRGSGPSTGRRARGSRRWPCCTASSCARARSGACRRTLSTTSRSRRSVSRTGSRSSRRTRSRRSYERQRPSRMPRSSSRRHSRGCGAANSWRSGGRKSTSRRARSPSEQATRWAPSQRRDAQQRRQSQRSRSPACS